jgi:hypothetical protein
MRGNRVGRLLAAALVLGGIPARAAMDPHFDWSFGPASTMASGDTVIFHLMNGPKAQDVQACLFSEDGQELACQSARLAAAGSSGDALTLSWTQTAPETVDLALGVGVDETHEGMQWAGTVMDQDGAVSGAFDHGSFLPSAHGHAPGAEHAEEPVAVAAFQNYPNPLITGQGTHFVFGVTGVSKIKSISIRVWSSSGQVVKSLSVSDIFARGSVFWDGRDDAGASLGTGIYIAEILLDGGGAPVARRLPLAVRGESAP